MLQLTLHTFDLPLKDTFTISRKSVDVQPSLVVELSDGTHTGFGEATANAYYGMTVPRMLEIAESVRGLVEQHPLDRPEALWHRLHARIGSFPFVQCALDEAAHDLFARQRGKRLYALWELDPAAVPVSNYTIGIDTPERMVAKLRAFPWPVYKIKLGTDRDLELVRELRRWTDAPFRIDANGGWTAAQTLAYAPELRALGVELLEQPLPADDIAGMRRVRAASVLPVFADESCRVEADLDACADLFHGVNLKLTKCGGLTPARRMIARARTLGLRVMAGCMTESSVGISALAHLAPLLDYVDMDGALLLRDDPATGVRVVPNGVVYAAGNGTGAALRAR